MNPQRVEWTQEATGFRLGFIRHPDVEFFTLGSTHFEAGVSCPDCHMPDMPTESDTIRDHNLMSPLKQDMKACARCHVSPPEELRAKVIAIQEANLGMFINAGYRVATVAKLFELANASLETSSADVKPRYDWAATHYRQAFYRVVYMGAENSVGFHNPAEGARILTEAFAEAQAAEQILRELLAEGGVSVPAELPLELRRYTDSRGVHGLDFNRDHYIPDPTGTAERTWPGSIGALLR